MKALSILLLLSSTISSAFAAELQVPAEIRDPGSIVLQGTPGANQKDNFQICFLRRDKNGRLADRGEGPCTAHKLGEDIHVPAGTYIVEYEGMTTITEVLDKQVPLTLLPLPLKKIDGTYSFVLYRDVTDRDEKLKIALERWVNHNSNLRIDVDDCDPKNKRPLDAAAKDLCNQMMNLKSPEDFLKIMKFEELGAVYSKTIFETEKIGNNNDWIRTADYPLNPSYRYRVGSGQDGDFLAVLPGVYAAKFWSAARHETTQSNIVVK